MAAKRVSLWDDEHRERYLDESDQAKARADARHDGEHTARDLPAIWQHLTPDERAVLEYLLLVGSPSVVALYDEGLLDALVAKGLLQRPPKCGVRGVSHPHAKGSSFCNSVSYKMSIVNVNR